VRCACGQLRYDRGQVDEEVDSHAHSLVCAIKDGVSGHSERWCVELILARFSACVWMLKVKQKMTLNVGRLVI
jgi:hypothetical protein